MRVVSQSLVVMIVLGCIASAAADDFRVETKVYTVKDKKKVSENLTLFEAGYVYDFLTDPDRVAVFDQPHGRFILLDPARGVKTEIKTDEVLKFTEQFHRMAARSKSALTKFAADPEFDVDFAANGELTMKSDLINYKVQTLTADTPQAAVQYREFSDWYARFNSMLNPGSTPPFPRLAVNAELARRQVLPTEVRLTIEKTSLRSEHHVSWRLLPRDHQKIAETANQLTTFKMVKFDEFQTPKLTKRSSGG